MVVQIYKQLKKYFKNFDSANYCETITTQYNEFFFRKIESILLKVYLGMNKYKCYHIVV